MSESKRHWGVHRLADIYNPEVQARLPRGRYVLAVARPYSGNRFRAAWEVFRGRAHAIHWPVPGELEAVSEGDPVEFRP